MLTVSKDITRAVLAMAVITLLCGVLYPLAITAVGQVAFPGNANGQLVKLNGHVIGSRLIGQSFAGQPRFFQSRPSGTTPADNAAGTSFANYGPNSTVTLAALRANIAAYIRLNGRYVPGGLSPAQVPVDAADTSASGIDPDISVANARLQAHRIASLRGLALGRVDALIARYTGGLGIGFSGGVDVNVLELNLALDRIAR